MFISAISVLCLLLAINFAVRWSVAPQVDNPIVTCPTIEIPTAKTDFIYSDFLKRKYNFHTDVNNQLISIKSILVKPNEELKVIFNQEPLNYLLLRKLDNDNYEK